MLLHTNYVHTRIFPAFLFFLFNYAQMNYSYAELKIVQLCEIMHNVALQLYAIHVTFNILVLCGKL